MKIAKVLLALVIGIGLLVPQGLAKDVWEMAQSEAYGEKSGGMLGRGFLNAGTSPVDIFVQTVNKTKSGPPLIGTLTGMAGGLGCTALRAGSGIVDVALFWVPGFNGFPVSRSYDNCLEETPEAVPAPTQFVAQEPMSAPIVTTVTAPAPVAPVVDQEPVARPKRVVRKHSAYDYVKK